MDCVYRVNGGCFQRGESGKNKGGGTEKFIHLRCKKSPLYPASKARTNNQLRVTGFINKWINPVLRNWRHGCFEWGTFISCANTQFAHGITVEKENSRVGAVSKNEFRSYAAQIKQASRVAISKEPRINKTGCIWFMFHTSVALCTKVETDMSDKRITHCLRSYPVLDIKKKILEIFVQGRKLW